MKQSQAASRGQREVSSSHAGLAEAFNCKMDRMQLKIGLTCICRIERVSAITCSYGWHESIGECSGAAFSTYKARDLLNELDVES